MSIFQAQNLKWEPVSDPVGIGGLVGALDLGDSGLTSLVGGGGKTTALFALGRQLPGAVVLSTTTKMGTDRTGGHRPLIDPNGAELALSLDRDRVVLTWKYDVEHRAFGYTPSECEAWLEVADHVVIEADGSRRRPFKAPAPHEPVVPPASTTLVVCVGAGAFGAVIGQCCHRPEYVAEIAGCEVSDRLDAARLARVLLDPAGSRKNCPEAARFVVLLNKVAPEHAPFVDELEGHLDGAAPVVAVAPFAPGESPESD